MNPGLVRQINDIVRPYRKARMGLLIVISDPVGQRGPTPPLAWQYMIGRNWYKHTIHGTQLDLRLFSRNIDPAALASQVAGVDDRDGLPGYSGHSVPGCAGPGAASCRPAAGG